jgi:isocitrate dehydrogenase
VRGADRRLPQLYALQGNKRKAVPSGNLLRERFSTMRDVYQHQTLEMAGGMKMIKDKTTKKLRKKMIRYAIDYSMADLLEICNDAILKVKKKNDLLAQYMKNARRKG